MKLLETVQEKEPAETLEEESGKKRRVVGSGKNKAKRKKTNTAKAKKVKPPPHKDSNSEGKKDSDDDLPFKPNEGDRDDDYEDEGGARGSANP